MKRFALAAALAVAFLIGGALAAPVEAGPTWYADSGPTVGRM